MTTNLFVIASVNQLRTDGSFVNLLPFFRTSWSFGVLNSAIFNSFQNWVEFGTILEGLRNFGEGCLNTPNPPRYATATHNTHNKKIHAPGGIRTHNLSRRAAAELRG